MGDFIQRVPAFQGYQYFRGVLIKEGYPYFRGTNISGVFLLRKDIHISEVSFFRGVLSNTLRTNVMNT